MGEEGEGKGEAERGDNGKRGRERVRRQEVGEGGREGGRYQSGISVVEHMLAMFTTGFLIAHA